MCLFYYYYYYNIFTGPFKKKLKYFTRSCVCECVSVCLFLSLCVCVFYFNKSIYIFCTTFSKKTNTKKRTNWKFYLTALFISLQIIINQDGNHVTIDDFFFFFEWIFLWEIWQRWGHLTLSLCNASLGQCWPIAIDLDVSTNITISLTKSFIFNDIRLYPNAHAALPRCSARNWQQREKVKPTTAIIKWLKGKRLKKKNNKKK